MYHSFTVSIPDAKGRIITKKKGSSVYILYQYGSVYKPDKKYAIPQRTIIGKVCPDDPERMYPNEKFETWFPDNMPQEEPAPAGRSFCLKIGLNAVISHIAEEYSLRPMLARYFGNDADLVLDLASYFIAEDGHEGRLFDDYAFNHPLFSGKMPASGHSDVDSASGATLGRIAGSFLQTAERQQCTGFLHDWVKRHSHKRRVCIVQDLADKSHEAGDTYITDFNRIAGARDFPVHNLGLVMDAENRMPLYYAEYPGSAFEVSQFAYMAGKAAMQGGKKPLFILDRGPFCREHIRYIDGKSYSFAIMCRGSSPLAADVILEIRDSFESERACRIASSKVYGTTVRARLFEGDTRERFFHIYFDPKAMAEEREQVEDKFDCERHFLECHTEQRVQFGKRYGKFLAPYYKGAFIRAGVRYDEFEMALKLCGYSCIITSEEMTAEEALVLCRGRETAGHLFCTGRSFRKGLPDDRMDEAWTGLLGDEPDDPGKYLLGKPSAIRFVEFVALIIRSRMFCLLERQKALGEAEEESGAESGTEPGLDCLTVARAICELERIEMCRQEGGSYKLAYALTKAQKKVLSAFGLDAGTIRKKAKELA